MSDLTGKQPPSPPDSEERTGFFERLRNRLVKTREAFSLGIERIFEGKNAIDDGLLEGLEELLITSDIGVHTSMALIEKISKRSSKISDTAQLKTALKEEITSLLSVTDPPASPPSASDKPRVIMVVGVNGVGKTTSIGKLAARATQRGDTVLIAAADTFRAAAMEQLVIWADRAGAGIVKHREKADPAAVVYDSIEAARARDVDIVLIDTAGRLHTKVNLMEELKKMKRIISNKIPGAPHEILLVLDATTGQNAIAQAESFHKDLSITGIILAKLDGTAKGGIAVSICQTLNVPLKYIGIGENIQDLHDFDPIQFTEALFEDSHQQRI